MEEVERDRHLYLVTTRIFVHIVYWEKLKILVTIQNLGKRLKVGEVYITSMSG